MDILLWVCEQEERSFVAALLVAIAGLMIRNTGSASSGDPFGNLTMLLGKGCYYLAAMFAAWGLLLLVFKRLEWR